MVELKHNNSSLDDDLQLEQIEQLFEEEFKVVSFDEDKPSVFLKDE